MLDGQLSEFGTWGYWLWHVVDGIIVRGGDNIAHLMLSFLVVCFSVDVEGHRVGVVVRFFLLDEYVMCCLSLVSTLWFFFRLRVITVLALYLLWDSIRSSMVFAFFTLSFDFVSDSLWIHKSRGFRKSRFLHFCTFGLILHSWFVHFSLYLYLLLLLVQHSLQLPIYLFVLFVYLFASSVTLQLKSQHSDLLLLLLQHS